MRENIERKQAQMQNHYNRKHFDGIRYEVGNVVVILRQPTVDQPSKLQAKYCEKPLQVMKVLPSDTYRVAELGSDGHEIYATTALMLPIVTYSKNYWCSNVVFWLCQLTTDILIAVI